LAENFNQYIFDQPMADPNIPKWENPGGGFDWAGDVLGIPGGCPSYPYTAGTPVAMPAGDPLDICAFFDGVEVFYGDRRSNMWLGSLDYTNALSDTFTLKAGISHEYDNNVFQYYLTNAYTTTPSGSLLYPQLDESSTYPTTQELGYVEGDVRIGKFLLDPGLTYAQRHYAFPADQGYATGTPNCPTTCNVYSGGNTQHILNPSFNGTYTFGPDDVLRFSYGDTANFVASSYVYTSSLSLVARNPFKAGTTFDPQLNHSADLMWEHNFGNNTTMRVGPYWNKTTNYYSNYRPFLGYFTNTCNPNDISSCTPCTVGTPSCIPVTSRIAVLQNNGQHNTTGLEFALNHIDNRPRGVSWWVSATYDNYWTSSVDIPGAYINTPLPSNIVNQGILIRAASNPLWSGTILADFHSDRFHFAPLLYYQADTFWNTGITSQCSNMLTNSATVCLANGGTPVAPYIFENEQIAHGWWRAQVTAWEELGTKRNFILGFKADNLFNQVTPTAPCFSSGTGCFPFDGPQSGIVNQTGNIYPRNFSQGPRLFYFFAGVKI
jgi:hypothetical protein